MKYSHWVVAVLVFYKWDTWWLEVDTVSYTPCKTKFMFITNQLPEKWFTWNKHIMMYTFYFKHVTYEGGPKNSQNCKKTII